MSEELKPCPVCGSDEIAEGYDTEGNSAFTCEGCGLGTAWGLTAVSRAAWNRRASPSTKGEGGGEDARETAKRIVDWDDNGRLADDEWLVERNETAIIAICRALLSSPDARREALEEAAKVAEEMAGHLKHLGATIHPLVQIGSHLETCKTIAAAIRALKEKNNG